MTAGAIMMRLVLVFVMTAVTELCPLLAINRPSSTADERQLTGSYQGHQRKTRSSQMGRFLPIHDHGNLAFSYNGRS